MKYAFSMPSWLKIATWLLLISLLTFSLKKPTLFWEKTNINDLSLALSFVCFTIAFFKKEFSIPVPKKTILLFCIGIASIVLGTVLSIFIFHTFASDAPREYARIAACIVILLEVYTIGSLDPSIYRRALIALTIPSLLLPFIFYLPPNTLSFFLDESQTRFTGFLYDPNYYATIQILPTFILLWLSVSSRKLLLTFIGLVLYAFSLGSIIWTGSRGGVFGYFVGLGILTLFILWKVRLKKSVVTLLFIVLASISAYVVMPRTVHQNVEARITSLNSVSTETTTSPELAILETNKQNRLTAILSKLTAQQGRFVIWSNASKEVLKNPLGYGPGYGNVVDIQGAYDDHHRVAHNTLLQVFLTGGIILFILLCVGGFYISKRLLRSPVALSEMHYLYAALLGIIASGIFLDSLWSRWVWVIIGLLLIRLIRPAPEF